MEITLIILLFLTLFVSYLADKEKKKLEVRLEKMVASNNLDIAVEQVVLSDKKIEELREVKERHYLNALNDIKKLGTTITDEVEILVLKKAKADLIAVNQESEKWQQKSEDAQRILNEANWTSINYKRNFSDEEFLKLQKGFVSKVMEAKWNLYFKDGSYIMERSWSETPVFKIIFDGNNAVGAFTKFEKNVVGSEESYVEMINETLNLFLEGVWEVKH